MKFKKSSNPSGLGFSEMMLCSDSVFAQVCREIEAGRWERVRMLLNLIDRRQDSRSGKNGHKS